MKVPLLDLKAQAVALGPELKKAVEQVMDSAQFIMGPAVTELEREIAQYSECEFGLGVSSGTDALLIALMALDVKAGDVVLTSPYSFFATAGVVARLGATPAFVDIDPDSFNISPAALEDWFKKTNIDPKRVKAIIPVHLYGQCADMDPIMAIANKYNVPVIEDAAQSIGSRYPSSKGVKRAGSMGLMGCYSFFPSKNLGCLGDAGLVTTNDAALYEKLVKLRSHGSKPKYYHSLIGGNFRIDTIQAAALLVKFPHLENWHAARQKNAAYYDQNLKVSGVKNPALLYNREYHIYNQYVITVSERRDELREFLTKSDIGTEIYYPVPFHEQECFQYLGYKKGEFPHSEYAASHTVALPIYPELTDPMKDYVIEKIGQFYG